MNTVPQQHAQLELFEATFFAELPNCGTQAHAVLGALLGKGRSRQTDWLPGHWRLAAAIHVLKRLGWPIKSELVHVAGRKRPITEYHIPPLNAPIEIIRSDVFPAKAVRPSAN